MPGGIDGYIGDAVAFRHCFDGIGLPLKVKAVQPQLFQHPELALAGLRGWGEHRQRGVIAPLFVRIVADPHRHIAEGPRAGDIDQRGLEIAPLEEAVHPRRGKPHPREAALQIVHELALVEVAEFLLGTFLPQLLDVDQRAHAAVDPGILQPHHLGPRSVGHDRPGAQVGVAHIEVALLALATPTVPFLAAQKAWASWVLVLGVEK